MACQPVPSSQQQHIMILIEEPLTVQTYLQLFADGCPEKFRPRICPHCLTQIMLHRHGKYNRHAYTSEVSFIFLSIDLSALILSAEKPLPCCRPF